MGVQLNIKDAATVELARELAGRTGRSVTETIRAALEHEKARREAAIAERGAWLEEIFAEARRLLPPDIKGVTSKELMDAIYEDDDE